MPLRALLHGVSIEAADIADEVWASLRGHRELTMPCCGSAAIARVSPRGLRHFAHKALQDPAVCASLPESEAHLRAKAEILAACRAAGFIATSERAAADGSWRADVLAERDNTRIAFEVQLTQQSISETRARASRYAAHGITACWLVGGKGRSATTAPDLHFVAADASLPAFRLYTDSAGALRVGVAPHIVVDAEPSLLLADFVTAYLHRRVQFATHSVGRGSVVATVNMFPYRCPKCRAYSEVYDVVYAGPWTRVSPCGRPVAPAGCATWMDAAADPGIVAAVRSYLASADGGGPWLADLQVAESARARARRIAFVCHRCDRPFPPERFDKDVTMWRSAGSYPGGRRIQVTVSSDAVAVFDPHWCVAPHGDSCATLTRGAS